MQKKVFLLAGAVIVIVAVAIGIYWYSQGPKTTLPPETKELEQETGPKVTAPSETQKLSQEQEQEQELPSTSGIDVSEVENLESELSAELDGISSDLTDLKGFEEDASLDELDSSLSGFTE